MFSEGWAGKKGKREQPCLPVLTSDPELRPAILKIGRKCSVFIHHGDRIREWPWEPALYDSECMCSCKEGMESASEYRGGSSHRD